MRMLHLWLLGLHPHHLFKILIGISHLQTQLEGAFKSFWNVNWQALYVI